MSDDVPYVSIGMPVFNGEKFVAEAIESVLAQTFDDWELVISDNGSTDDTARICENFAASDQRIRFVRSPTNRGAAWNFNHVLQLSRATYFKWLAADDYLAPEFLSTALAALEDSPEACLAYSPGVFVNSAGSSLYEGTRFSPGGEWPNDTAARARVFLSLLLKDGRAAQVLVFGLIRRNVLVDVRPLGAYHAADWTLTMELVLRATVVELPTELVFFRRHQGSSSSSRKTWNRRLQQEFYNPRVANRILVTLNHYRRYAELPISPLFAPLPNQTRARIFGATIYDEARSLLPRAFSRAHTVFSGWFAATSKVGRRLNPWSR